MDKLKRVLGFVVIVLTIGYFVYYWRAHPDLAHQLRHIRLIILFEILGLYSLVIGSLIVAYSVILRLVGTRLPMQENILLTLYSTIVNFFGPLQSGPGVRTVYLKKRHKVSIKAYTKATFLYYGAFALISGIFLLVGAPWWLLGLLAVGLLVVGGLVLYVFKPTWPLKLIGYLFAATCVQLIVTALVYRVEIAAVGTSVSLRQAFTYAGAANFALFVSLTPGALGFRESFLLLSQRLHHIDSSTIVAANVLDRGVYALFLGILFIFILAVHAKDKLKV